MNEKTQTENAIVVQIIDDDKITRSLLTKVLLKLGYQVISSGSGIEGIEQYIVERPDIILLDVLMPGMSGYEVCLELRKPEYDKSLPILMLTGLEDVESINEAFSVGATDFVTKPVNLALLGERLKYALKGKQMYLDIQDQSNELSAILASASDGIITTDIENNILGANPTAHSLFSTGTEPLIGKNLNEFIAQNQISDMAGGAGISATGKHHNGETFPLEYTLSFISNQTRNVKCFFITDLTERLRIERMKSEFIQTVSHELRTPIAAIQGATSILSSGILGEQPADVEELLNIPASACKKLEIIVDDMLDITVIEDPSQTLNISSLTVETLFDEIRKTHSEMAKQGDIELVLENNSEQCFSSDPSRILKVIGHLVTNAIKFSPKGEKVTISSKEKIGEINIFVSDNGPGILIEDKDKIYEKFYQIDNSSTRQQGGTGLGLYISKMTAKKLNGNVEILSTSESGTTFVFSLPIISSTD